MPSSFPTSVPTYVDPVSSNTLGADGHTARHLQHDQDIVAVATKVGTGSGNATNNTVLRGNGAGTSQWAQVQLGTDVTGTLATSLGGTGTTNTTGTGSVVFGTSPSLSGPTITGTVAGSATYSTPTLTQPTIANFTSATHNHSNKSGGGTFNVDNLTGTAWSTYTPALTSTIGANPTYGNSVITGNYKQIGKTVFFRIYLQVGSTFSVGAGTGVWRFSYPVTATSVMTAGEAIMGTFYYHDVSASLYVPGQVVHQDTGTMTVFYFLKNSGSTNGVTFDFLSSTSPATTGTGDELVISGTYEAA